MKQPESLFKLRQRFFTLSPNISRDTQFAVKKFYDRKFFSARRKT